MKLRDFRNICNTYKDAIKYSFIFKVYNEFYTRSYCKPVFKDGLLTLVINSSNEGYKSPKELINAIENISDDCNVIFAFPSKHGNDVIYDFTIPQYVSAIKNIVFSDKKIFSDEKVLV